MGTIMRLKLKISAYRAFPRGIAVGVCALALLACQAATQRHVTKMNFSRDDFSSLRKAAVSDPEKKGRDQSKTKEAAAGDQAKGDSKLPPATDKWEFRALKDLVTELARDSTDVHHMKLCYAAEGHEWWITLYHEKDSVYDLRTHIWSVNHDKPEPFLQLRTIDKRNLERDLSTADKGCRCKAFELTKNGWMAREPEPSPKPGEKQADTAGKDSGTKPKNAATRSGTSVPKRKKKKNISRPPTDGELASPAAADSRPAGTNPRDARPKPQDKPYFRTAVAGPNPYAPGHKESDSGRIRPSPSYAPRKKESAGGLPNRSGWEQGSVGKACQGVDPAQKRNDRGSRIRRTPHRMAVWSDVEIPESSRRFEAGKKGPAPVPSTEMGRKRKNVPTCFVFAYGSKMNHQHQLSALESAGHDSSLVVDAFPAELKGYDLVWNYYSQDRRGGTVNLEPAPGASVYGLAIEMGDSLLPVWDRIQGHPQYYSRGVRRLPVRRLKDGKTFFAWVYRAKPSSDGRRNIRPTPEYKQSLLQAANFWRLPSDYIDKIKACPAE